MHRTVSNLIPLLFVILALVFPLAAAVVEPFPSVTPGAPGGLRAIQENGYTRLIWTPASPGLGPAVIAYEVERKITPDAEWEPLAVVDGITLTYNAFSGWDPSRPDEYRVRAVGFAGPGPFTPAATTEIPGPVSHIMTPKESSVAGCPIEDATCTGSVTCRIPEDVPDCLDDFVNPTFSHGAPALACDGLKILNAPAADTCANAPAVVHGRVPVVALAYSGAGVARVDYLVNGQLRHSTTTPFALDYYRWIWNSSEMAPLTPAILTVVVTDLTGETTQDEVRVVVG